MHKPPPTRLPSAPPVYRPVIVISRANVQMVLSVPLIQRRTVSGVPAGRELHTPRPYTVVQARMQHGQPKIYPNLNPAAAALKVDTGEFMRLDSSFDQNYFRMRRGGDHGVLVPNSKYIFVHTMDGETVMHQRYRHPVLAQGRPVLYAGEAHFNNGRLDWWSNGSGNYRPDSDHAEQAGLPMEKFFSYEQVLKGAHKQT